VESGKLSPDRRQAIVALLDDHSPAVRRALLAELKQHGREAQRFLEGLARGPNRMVGWHAQWFLAELKFADPVAEFKGFIRSLNYELETGALLLSRTVHPDLDVGVCCGLLDQMAARCRELIVEPATHRDKCRVLNRVLFHEFGFHGNVEHYTDPANSFLDRVLERRKGIPVTLCLVYLLVAQRCGLDLEPVGVPGHFLVGCYVEGSPFFVDPFENGLFRSADEVFELLRRQQVVPKITDLAPTPVREVLHRCCRNLVHHYGLAGQAELAQLFNEFAEEFESSYLRESSA
jgi:regulator of sirC expression with transglutaminase-like and TPR domain